MASALTKYLEFHGHDGPDKVGAFHRDLAIPDRALRIGDATQMLYRSNKLNPTTLEDEGWIEYFHDHSRGVGAYRCDAAAAQAPGRIAVVPAWIRRVRELTWLGKCLGYSYRDGDGRHEVKATEPLPELYCIPSGRALLVIQGKRHLLAMMWGGQLRVEDRGIVH